MKNRKTKKYFSKIIFISFLLVAFLFISKPALAVGNTTGTAELSVDSSAINFSCSSCNINTLADKITGYAWGTNVGWINLNPTGAGVLNDGNGILSGYAWGENAGWINFKSGTNPSIKVEINSTTGEFLGDAWSENYGWIKFDCGLGAGTCVTTTWRKTVSSGGGGGSSTPTPPCPAFTCSWGDCTDGLQTQTCSSDPVFDFACTPLIPALPISCSLPSSCTADEWDYNWGECSPEGIVTGTAYLLHDCEAVSTPAKPDDLTQPCTPTTPPPCPAFTCSWGDCINGTKVQTCSSDPVFDFACTPLIPALPISCLLPPSCTADIWDYNWSVCSPEGTRTGTAYKSFDCLAVSTPSKPDDLTQSCTSTTPTTPAEPGATTEPGTEPGGTTETPTTTEPGSEPGGTTEPTLPETPGEPTIINQIQNFLGNIINQGQALLPESVNKILGITATNIVKQAEFAKEIIQTPVGNIITKALSALGLITLLSVIPIDILFLPFRLWSIFLSILGLRKKVRPWGAVYDSITKQPMDPAYVVLVDSMGKEINTSITDLDGRYGFLVTPGIYTMIANKTNHTFPSIRLAGKTTDGIYTDLYFGGPITISHEDEVIIKNIPLDPINFDWNEFAKKEQKLMKFYSRKDFFVSRILDILFYAGFVVAVVSLFAAPEPYNLIVFALYILMLVLRVVGVLKPKTKGSIKDQETGKPLPFAVLKIFSGVSNTLLATKTTNKYGRFYCLMPKGIYYVKIEKKNLDGSFTEIFTSEIFHANKGIIDKNWVV